MVVGLTWTQPVVLVMTKTSYDELLGSFRNTMLARGVSREYYFMCSENDSFVVYLWLGNTMPKGFATIEQLKKDNS